MGSVYDEDGKCEHCYGHRDSIEPEEANALRQRVEDLELMLRELVAIDPFDHDAPTGQSAGLQAVLKKARAALRQGEK